MPKYKTTPRDFEVFKENVVRWMRTFGLTDWQMEMQHKLMPNQGETVSVCARTNWDYCSRSVLFTLNMAWIRPPLGQEIESVAFHEVAHLLLAPLVHEATNRYTTAALLDVQEEAIVLRLENAFTPTALTPRPTEPAAGMSRESTGTSGPPSFQPGSLTSVLTLGRPPSS